LFTSLFTHLRGPLDSALTYLPWLRRAGGDSPHLHPWTFYFDRLFSYQAPRGPFWSEGFLGLLALAGMGAALAGRGLGLASVAFARFLTFHTLAIAGVYTLIPYKTPWCLLNFLLPLALLAGLGAAVVIQRARSRGVLAGAALVLAIGGSHLAWQAWRVSHDPAVQRTNPYAYSQTLPHLVELAERIKAIASVSPDGGRTEVKVVVPASDYWPLPWYLRQLGNVWWLDALPENPYAPIVVVAARLQAALDEKSGKRHLSVGYYEQRPGEFLELYVEFELWKRFVETLPRPKDDG